MKVYLNKSLHFLQILCINHRIDFHIEDPKPTPNQRHSELVAALLFGCNSNQKHSAITKDLTWAPAEKQRFTLLLIQ